ncbi:MAG TPA: hypothetical protein VHO47_00945 [Candidatus Babeliales bacterium]|nr:hypothetical protein [Candidatus Babeliales bacterium]
MSKIHSIIIMLIITATSKAVINEVDISLSIAAKLKSLDETKQDYKELPDIEKNDDCYFIAAIVDSSFQKRYFLFDVGKNILSDGSANKFKMADIENLIGTKLLNTKNTRIEWWALKDANIVAVKKTFGKNTKYQLVDMSNLFSQDLTSK